MWMILPGLLGLWLGTRFILLGALGLAQRFKLSHSFVGLVILAIGTDLPEVFVTINASIQNLNGVPSSGIIIGNAIGSSISQITIILGITALVLRLQMPVKTALLSGAILLLSIFLLYICGSDGVISRIDGSIFLITYLLYFLFLAGRSQETNDTFPEVTPPLSATLLRLGAGFIVLIYASHLVVDNAIRIAEYMGVSQTVIGILLIGVGTSLPELAISIGAAIKGTSNMSVGNIIGSNIFDGLIPIGLGASISPLTIHIPQLHGELIFLAIITIVVLFFLRSQRGLSKREGIFLITLFLGYALFTLYNQ